jgi:hypothetical protein
LVVCDKQTHKLKIDAAVESHLSKTAKGGAPGILPSPARPAGLLNFQGALPKIRVPGNPELRTFWQATSQKA